MGVEDLHNPRVWMPTSYSPTCFSPPHWGFPPIISMAAAPVIESFATEVDDMLKRDDRIATEAGDTKAHTR